MVELVGTRLPQNAQYKKKLSMVILDENIIHMNIILKNKIYKNAGIYYFFKTGV